MAATNLSIDELIATPTTKGFFLFDKLKNPLKKPQTLVTNLYVFLCQKDFFKRISSFTCSAENSSSFST